MKDSFTQVYFMLNSLSEKDVVKLTTKFAYILSGWEINDN